MQPKKARYIMQEFFFIIRAAKNGESFKDHNVTAHGQNVEEAKAAAVALFDGAIIVNIFNNGAA